MANVTIQEFFSLPDQDGNVARKADLKTTIDTTATHTLSDRTRYVIISAAVDCRVSWDDTAAVDSDENILSAIAQAFVLAPVAPGASSRTLKFLA